MMHVILQLASLSVLDYCCTGGRLQEVSSSICCFLQAEKNLAWEAAQAQNASMLQMSAMAGTGSGPCKLYVANLHPNIQVLSFRCCYSTHIQLPS